MTTAARPNVLLLMADQQRGDTLDPGSACQTPNLDRLTRSGVRFARAHTTNAVCSPSRASLFTGLYPSRHGMVDCTHSVPPDRADLRPGLPFWSQRLHEAGYTGAYFGKWHVERSGDLGRYGFGEFFINQGPQDAAEYGAYRRRYGLGPERALALRRAVRQPGYRDLLLYGVSDEPPEAAQPSFIYSKGTDFIRRRAAAGGPWFCVVSTHEPHDPYVAPRHCFERYRPGDLPLPATYHDDLQHKPGIQRRLRTIWQDLAPREVIACYYANCNFVDEQVGRILQALEETGQLDDTVILYTADHGDLLGDHGLFFKGAPAYEAVYNVPLIVAGPGVTDPGRTSEALVSLVDLAPTIASLTGTRSIEDADGRSLVPLLEHRAADLEESPWADGYAEFHGQRFFFTQRIVWQGRHKYVFNGFDVDELYDLSADPHEVTNLAADPAHRPLLEAMAARMWRRARALGDVHLLGAHYAMFRLAPVGPLGIDGVPPALPGRTATVDPIRAEAQRR